jgi:hypothetical protein
MNTPIFRNFSPSLLPTQMTPCEVRTKLKLLYAESVRQNAARWDKFKMAQGRVSREELEYLTKAAMESLTATKQAFRILSSHTDEHGC